MRDYLRELVLRLRAVLGSDLVGVYVGGSYALGAYEPGRSDADVAAVVRSRARRESKQAIVDATVTSRFAAPRAGSSSSSTVWRLSKGRRRRPGSS